ncbi:hypothetical protein, partial [Escherichia coli]|uniref:hypothetical protein n=1 Tax=Escherichia coli TaxID=562 RepID=UPI00196B6C27
KSPAINLCQKRVYEFIRFNKNFLITLSDASLTHCIEIKISDFDIFYQHDIYRKPGYNLSVEIDS